MESSVVEYIKSINSDHIKEPQKSDVNLALIIPVYNEELFIEGILKSLNSQTYRFFEVIIVDNGSKDKSIQVVKNLTKTLNYPLYLLEEYKPGPGNARKRGMDEAVYRFYQKDNKLKKNPYILVTTDADTIAHPYWLEKISKTFKSNKVGGVAGTHIAKSKVNQLIKNRHDLNNYFNVAHELILYLAKNKIGKIKMSGPNCAFSSEAYCIAGGIEQPYVNNKVGVKEIKLLQDKIENAGYIIEHSYCPIIANQRRHLYEILNGGDHANYISTTDSPRFVSVRTDEYDLLHEALEQVPREIWAEYQTKILKSVVKNTIVKPYLNKEITRHHLAKIIDETEFDELENDKDVFAEFLVNKLTKI